MHFKSFCSIENHTNAKTLAKICELLYENENLKSWVALEKVHGCNFSFLVSSREGVRVAKRTAILEEGENLNNISTRKLLDKYGPCAKQAYEMLNNMRKDKNKIKQLTIFGELFGGHYPHPNVPVVKDAKLAQKGIYYHNDNDFYAFDIYDGQNYLDYDVCMNIFQQCGFFYAEPLCRGTFEEVLKFPNTFETTLPKHYGHPSLNQENIAEGLVLKPIRAARMHNGQRVILKNKREEYAEVNPKKKQIYNCNDVDKVWETLKLYVTKNRLENVESHGLYGKNCIGPLSCDALKEFSRDEVIDIYENLSKQQKKIVKKRLSVACQTLVTKYS